MGRGGRQVHQNKVRYDPNRYKDEKDRLPNDILVSMTSLCCKRCCSIIRWKADYGKYIPLDRARKCNLCEGKTVGLAYHRICQACAEQHRICAKCQKSPLEALAVDEAAEESSCSESQEGEDREPAKVNAYAFVDEVPSEEQLKPLQGLDTRMVRKKLRAQLSAEEQERVKFLRERERRTVMRKAKNSTGENDREQVYTDSDEELL